MENVRNYIFQQVAANRLPKEDAKALLKELYQAKTEPADRPSPDIAIVGMACKLPGADNLDAYWSVLANGVRTMGDFPFNRRRDTDKFVSGGLEYRKGGYLDQVDRFDAPFFRISRREAEAMDPMQRMFLEIAWEAMEDSGIGSEKLSNTRTAVYVGQETNYNNEYRKLLAEEDELSMTGSHTGIIASRIQYLLNLRGPSLVLDTACSSSLVALHLACQGLRNNEFDYALVGGISAFFFPAGQTLVMESGKAEIRAFDKDASGTCWSEGFGAVMLKPLDKAKRDGDHIHAVIKGSAMNNDGTSNGITAPNADSQAEVLTAAWEAAGIAPETISYVETHGTGTPLGDPIEIKGLTKAFRRYTNKRQFCGIGSVKTNIGHAVATSGIASLIKVVLAMQHKQLPQSLAFQAPNPYINFSDSPVYVNDSLRKWETDDTARRAGVSAFGFSGTNVHVVLEEAPAQPAPARAERGPELFTVSARTETALRSLLKSYADYVQEHGDAALADLCYTVNTGRRHYAIRLAFLVRTAEELLHKLRQAAAGDLEGIPARIADSYYGVHKLIFHKQAKQAGELTEQDVLQLSDDINGKLAELTSSGLTAGSIDEIARVYVAGADVHWSGIYKQQECRTLRVPTYPFDKLRYWASGEHLLQQKDAAEGQLVNAPLLDRIVSRTASEAVYEKDYNANKHWVLSEHVVSGHPVLPGTSYVEMALEAGEQYLGQPPGGIEDIQFLAPFVVEPAETKRLRIAIREEEQRLYFTVSSPEGGEADGIVHAVGELLRADERTPERYDLAELAASCPQTAALEGEAEQSASPGERGIVFGPRFQNIAALRAGDSEALVELELPARFAAETDMFRLHPAILDKATGAVSDLLAGEGDLFLAFAYRRLRMFGRLPAKVFSYVRKLPTSSRELLMFEVTIMDEQGNALAEIDKFTVKKLGGRSQSLLNQVEQAPFFYETGWREVDGPPAAVAGIGAKERICVVKDRFIAADDLLDKLRAEGHSVLQVDVGEPYRRIGDNHYTVSGSEDDYAQLLADTANAPFGKLVHLSGWRKPQAADYAELQRHQISGVYDLFRLTRALVKSKRTQPVEIVLVADNARAVTARETALHPVHAALFGLGKVVGAEHPDFICRCIDADEATGVEQLYRELHAEDAPYAIAYREGKRYAEEIRPLALEAEPQPIALQAGGVYVVTGGTGGIGLEIARSLAAREQIKLVLLHRSSFPERSTWEEQLASGADAKLTARLRLLQAMEASGSQVVLVQADVADRESLGSALEQVRRLHGPVRGVVHSAGVAGDGFLIRKEEATFRRVLAPKIDGAWLLDELTREDKPDFFVLFSSVTSFLGGPGQGDYTAANAFLDAFAEYRTKLGERTLTINWPAWKETGMAYDYGVNHDGIFKALTTAEALAGFDTALQSSVSRAIVGELNYDLIRDAEQAPLLLSEDIVMALKRHDLKARRTTAGSEQKRSGAAVVLEGRPSGSYSEKERQLAAVWGEVLGVERISIQDSFYDLGGDSLLAIKISNLIDKTMGQKVDISDLFEYLTIFELARALGGDTPEPGSSSDQPETSTDSQPAPQPEGERAYSLSNAQKRIWFLHKLNPDLHAYHLPLTFETELPLERPAFEAALRLMTARHGSLRTVIREEAGEPKQVVLPELDVEPVWQDPQPGVTDEALVRQELERPFDFSEKLWRVRVFPRSDGRCFICLIVHHIISDGWSMMLFKDELLQIYTALQAGEAPALTPLQAEYGDWLQTMEARERSEEFRHMERYWLDELVKPLPLLQLPADYPRPAVQTYGGSYVIFDIDAKLTAQIKDLAKSSKASLHMFLLTGYFLFLHKLTRQEDLIVGYPIAGRESQEWEPVLGLFMNIVCMRLALTEEKTFAELLAEVRHKSLQAYKNGSYPFDLLVSKLNPERDMSRSPVFQTLFQFYENYQQNEHHSLYELCFLCKENDDKLEVRLEYNTDLFAQSTIERFARQFLCMLQQIAADAQRPIANVSLHSEQEAAALLADYASDRPELLPDRTVVEWFRQTAADRPDASAVACDGRSITYRELEERSNQIAGLLVGAGVRANEPVGLMLDRSIELIAGMLGILKAGGAYVPLDPGYPAERLGYMLEHSEARVLVTEAAYREAATGFVKPGGALSAIVDLTGRSGEPVSGYAHTFSLDDVERRPSSPLPAEAALDDLMYVIYTSGSTGRPKGVAVSHRNAANFLKWSIADGAIGLDDRMALLTSVSFDISVFEIFGALLSGAGLSVATPQQLLDPAALLAFVTEQRITVWHSVPALMRQLLLHLRQAPEAAKRPAAARLRRVMLGGEAWNGQVALEIGTAFPQADILNMYGPTEATIWISSSRVGSTPESGNLPIGRPIANNRLLVLDGKGRLCPVGVPGQIAIGGVNVTQGYYKDKAKTDEAFVHSPLLGERIYLTGDIGLFSPSGELRFLGREDGMVKVRGYRIEIGEIESTLLRNRAIAETAVIARAEAGTFKLVCYYSSGSGQNTGQLREQLRQSLPEYMLPAHFIQLDELPKTANGKIDRKRLAELPLHDTAPASDGYAEPATEAERHIGAIWCELLGIGHAGVHDNFFEIGGNSFLVSQMHYQIEQLYPGRISVVDIFSYPTISALADYIGGRVESDEKSGVAPEQSDSELEKELYDMFDEIASGNVSVEDAVKKLT